jgi:hypothetical protein
LPPNCAFTRREQFHGGTSARRSNNGGILPYVLRELMSKAGPAAVKAA